MPTKDKVDVSLEIERDHVDWLREMAGKYGLPDESKALRVLLDYSIDEINEAEVFAPENMRCRHCRG